jgi:hypothetical protein
MLMALLATKIEGKKHDYAMKIAPPYGMQHHDINMLCFGASILVSPYFWAFQHSSIWFLTKQFFQFRETVKHAAVLWTVVETTALWNSKPIKEVKISRTHILFPEIANATLHQV